MRQKIVPTSVKYDVQKDPRLPRQSPVSAAGTVSRTRWLSVLVISVLLGFLAGMVGTLVTIRALGLAGFGQVLPSIFSIQQSSRSDVARQTAVKNISSSMFPMEVALYSSSAPQGSPGYEVPVPDNLVGWGIMLTSDGLGVTASNALTGKSVLVKVRDMAPEPVNIVGTDRVNGLSFFSVGTHAQSIVNFTADHADKSPGKEVYSVQDAVTGRFSIIYPHIVVSSEYPPNSKVSLIHLSEEAPRALLITQEGSLLPGTPVADAAGNLFGMVKETTGDGVMLIDGEVIQRSMNTFLANKSLVSAYLGVHYVDLSEDAEISKAYHIHLTQGAYVFAGTDRPVDVGSPADKAGIKKGDVIISVDKDMLTKNLSLAQKLREYTTGDHISIGIARGDQSITVDATLTSLPQ